MLYRKLLSLRCNFLVVTLCYWLYYMAVVVDSHIQRTVLATEETTVTQQVSHRPIKCRSLSRGHKEVRRSAGHIMVTTRYSGQQGFKSRQNPCSRSNQPRTSETYRRHDDVFENELHILLSVRREEERARPKRQSTHPSTRKGEINCKE